MNVGDFASYAGLVALPLIALPVLDIIAPESTRHAMGRFVQAMFNTTAEPKSWRCYFAVSGTSLVWMVIAVLLTGGWEKYMDNQRLSVAAKSTGLMIVAVCLKIGFWDYLMALKSSYIQKQCAESVWLKGIIGILDIFFTIFITVGFVGLFETAQTQTKLAQQAVETPLVQQVMELFNEFSFFSRAVLQKTIYVLNGTTIWYVVRFWDRISPILIQEQSVREKPFMAITVMVVIVTIIVLLTMAWYQFSQR